MIENLIVPQNKCIPPFFGKNYFFHSHRYVTCKKILFALSNISEHTPTGQDILEPVAINKMPTERRGSFKFYVSNIICWMRKVTKNALYNRDINWVGVPHNIT